MPQDMLRASITEWELNIEVEFLFMDRATGFVIFASLFDIFGRKKNIKIQ